MQNKRSRKTINVVDIKEDINKLLALDSDRVSEDSKKDLCAFLESVLMKTHNYMGYNYVDWLNGGFDKWWEDGQPDFPEKSFYIGREYSRRYY